MNDQMLGGMLATSTTLRHIHSARPDAPVVTPRPTRTLSGSVVTRGRDWLATALTGLAERVRPADTRSGTQVEAC